jgi:ATP-binding cassette subfamily F protein 3
VLLDSASVTLNPGEKVGLVGRNGAGKSSLFALLNGNLHEDAANFTSPPNGAWARWRRTCPKPTRAPPTSWSTATPVLLAAQQEVTAPRPPTTTTAWPMPTWPCTTPASTTHPARAQALILGLGFKTTELDNPVNSFLGRLAHAPATGARADVPQRPAAAGRAHQPPGPGRAGLAGGLAEKVRRHHDRHQPRPRVSGRGDQRHPAHRRAKLVRYGGNYSKFEDMRAEQMALQPPRFAKQQDKIAHLQKFIDRFKAKASKAKQAQSRVKALDRMEKIAPLLAEADFTFEFKEPANLPNPMLSMQGVSFGYPPPEARPGHAAHRHRAQRQQIGAGRPAHRHSGRQRPGQIHAGQDHGARPGRHGGEVTEGKGLNIGYFAQQELDVLRPSRQPAGAHDRLAKELGAASKLAGQATREQDLRSFLGTFNFSGDMVKQAVGSMSGGEKARLVLCMIVWQRPNLLLLDEPTNHLDLATREALAMALNEFEGTVMLVSHDRRPAAQRVRRVLDGGPRRRGTL